MRGYVKENSSLIVLLFYVADWLVVVGAALLSSKLYLQQWLYGPQYLSVIVLGVVLSAWIFSLVGLYGIWRGMSMLVELRQLLVGWSIVLSVLVLLAAFTKSSELYSRGWMLLWFVIGLVGLACMRVSLRLALRWLRSRGYNKRHVIVLGFKEAVDGLCSRVSSTPWAGFQVSRTFSLDGLSGEEPIVGISEVLTEVDSGAVDQVWITLPLREELLINAVLHELRKSSVVIRYFPDMYGMNLINQSATEVIGLPVINLSTSPMVGKALLLKEIEDRVLSLLALLLLSPVLLIIALAVKVTSPGPVLYRQERIGWSGRPFQMLKFRSMSVDSEADGVTWGGASSMSVTPVGAFLRRTSLDELPQFFNVLRGDMSIVGPRPERTVFVDQFKEEIPNYMKKHLVKAGITGWAQVNGLRGDTDLHKRIEYDIFYVENWSIWFDLKIMLLTVFKGMATESAV